MKYFTCLDCGANFLENENDYELTCPYCNSELLDMDFSDEELEGKSNFFKHNFIENKERKILWDDFEEVKEICLNDKNIKIFTVVTGDWDTAWVTKGWHLVNRVGCLLTYDEIDFDENDEVRYW